MNETNYIKLEFPSRSSNEGFARAAAAAFAAQLDPNMEELGYAFDPVVNDSNGFMLESHGALVCSPKGVLYAIESLQVMESLAESIIVGRIMSKKLKCLTREDAEGIDGVIHELGWALPGAPGRYKTITEMFYH